MSDEPYMPYEVVEAIRSNRKVEAIKLLRLSTGLDLKDAKEAVEAFMYANPDLQPKERRGAQEESALGRFILFAMFVALVMGAYQYFTS